MKKALLVLGLGSLIVLIAVYIGVAYFLGSIVKTGVNTLGPKLTQTKVELAGAHLSPLTGSGTLSGLTVGNPKGWSEGNAFSLGKVHVDVEPFSIFGEHVVINEIVIDEPVFNYETKIVSSNIKDLLKNIEKFSGSGENQAATNDAKPVKFVVKQFRLTNAKATLGLGATALPVPLPPVSLDNIGVDRGGITADELAGEIMSSVLGSIVSGTANALGQVGSASGSMTVEQVKEAAKNAGDAIKGLFKKD
ncbi:hypothetical protein ESB00_05240 [Oleiharenicola lentus]|uniref:AsmA family protein n=1 Tax=Oleiharenicola lentus TaxID=2508720 RepID=A0A4Q1C8M2_9BACT|nr:hypothetical protein [Oleiharenicola lentus]RXK55303.1 hypothetical protein ESB00_05240 [Oleiharenicola lentus]